MKVRLISFIMSSVFSTTFYITNGQRYQPINGKQLITIISNSENSQQSDSTPRMIVTSSSPDRSPTEISMKSYPQLIMIRNTTTRILPERSLGTAGNFRPQIIDRDNLKYDRPLTRRDQARRDYLDRQVTQNSEEQNRPEEIPSESEGDYQSNTGAYYPRSGERGSDEDDRQNDEIPSEDEEDPQFNNGAYYPRSEEEGNGEEEGNWQNDEGPGTDYVTPDDDEEYRRRPHHHHHHHHHRHHHHHHPHYHHHHGHRYQPIYDNYQPIQDDYQSIQDDYQPIQDN